MRRIKHLLDTHAFLWAAADEDRLGAEAARVIAKTPYPDLAISDVTLQEIGLLLHLGRISFAGRPEKALGAPFGVCDRSADFPRDRDRGAGIASSSWRSIRPHHHGHRQGAQTFADHQRREYHRRQGGRHDLVDRGGLNRGEGEARLTFRIPSSSGWRSKRQHRPIQKFEHSPRGLELMANVSAFPFCGIVDGRYRRRIWECRFCRNEFRWTRLQIRAGPQGAGSRFEVAGNRRSGIFTHLMATVVHRRSKSISTENRSAVWLARVRKMPAAQCVAAIERKLALLPKTPTAANVFFRKQLLRLRDERRLKAGLVSIDQLQRENSPFAGMDFRAARIEFRRRARV